MAACFSMPEGEEGEAEGPGKSKDAHSGTETSTGAGTCRHSTSAGRVNQGPDPRRLQTLPVGFVQLARSLALTRRSASISNRKLCKAACVAVWLLHGTREGIPLVVSRTGACSSAIPRNRVYNFLLLSFACLLNADSHPAHRRHPTAEIGLASPVRLHLQTNGSR